MRLEKNVNGDRTRSIVWGGAFTVLAAVNLALALSLLLPSLLPPACTRLYQHGVWLATAASSDPMYASILADTLVRTLLLLKSVGGVLLFGMLLALAIRLMRSGTASKRLAVIYLVLSILWTANIELFTLYVRHVVARVHPASLPWLESLLRVGEAPALVLISPPFISLLHVVLALCTLWALRGFPSTESPASEEPQGAPTAGQMQR